MSEMYKCSICKEEKLLESFYLNNKGKRRSAKCKPSHCKEQYKGNKINPNRIKYVEENREKAKEYARGYYKALIKDEAYKEKRRQFDKKYRTTDKYRIRAKEYRESKKNHHLIGLNKQLHKARKSQKEKDTLTERIEKYKPIAEKYNTAKVNVELEWKYIEGYNNEYKISNHGDVYSCKRLKILKQMTTTYGYLIVTLNQSKVKVHRLVAEAFILNSLNKPHVNHIDANKKNNNINNLEWATAQENTDHKLCVKLGLIHNNP